MTSFPLDFDSLHAKWEEACKEHEVVSALLESGEEMTNDTRHLLGQYSFHLYWRKDLLFDLMMENQ